MRTSVILPIILSATSGTLAGTPFSPRDLNPSKFSVRDSSDCDAGQIPCGDRCMPSTNGYFCCDRKTGEYCTADQVCDQVLDQYSQACGPGDDRCTSTCGAAPATSASASQSASATVTATSALTSGTLGSVAATGATTTRAQITGPTSTAAGARVTGVAYGVVAAAAVAAAAMI